MSDEGSMTKSDIKNNLMNTYKTITVCYIVTGVNIELQVKLSMTVKELKKKIEKEFGFPDGFLKDHKLRMNCYGERDGKLLKDDNSNLAYYKVKNETIIRFGKEKNEGAIII